MKVTNVKLGIAEASSLIVDYDDYHVAFNMMNKGSYVYVRVKSALSIVEIRNNLVKVAQNYGCTHLLMLDTDMIPHVDTVDVLLSRKVSLIGALYFKRYPPFLPVTIKDGTVIDDWEKDSVFEVDRIGAGVMMYEMSVFDNIEYPWFDFKHDKEGILSQTEDYYFCEKAKKAGYKIYCDSSIPAGHISTLEINEDFWRFYNFAKNIAEKQKAKKAKTLQIAT